MHACLVSGTYLKHLRPMYIARHLKDEYCEAACKYSQTFQKYIVGKGGGVCPLDMPESFVLSLHTLQAGGLRAFYEVSPCPSVIAANF